MKTLLLLLLAAPALAMSSPMERELNRLARKGYTVERKATARVAGGRVTAFLFKKGARRGFRIYRIARGKAKLIHMEPGFGKRIELSSVHASGKLPDLIGDGSVIIAYREIPPGHMEESFTVMRYAKGGITRVAKLPYGAFEDIDGDGVTEVTSSERPFGSFFDLSCGEHLKSSPSVFRTSVYAFKGRKLVDVSHRHPDYFEGLIRSGEEALAPLDPRSVADFGEYLGNAVSLYFDYTRAGRRREGWRRLHALFPVKWSDPGAVKECFKSVKVMMRDKLAIPADW